MCTNERQGTPPNTRPSGSGRGGNRTLEDSVLDEYALPLNDDAASLKSNHKNLGSNFAAKAAWDGKARLCGANWRSKEQDVQVHVPRQALKNTQRH